MEHVPNYVSEPPYDFKKKVSCPHCIELIWELRRKLCKKYNWSKWPDDLKGNLEGE